jgi:DUF917 family protein
MTRYLPCAFWCAAGLLAVSAGSVRAQTPAPPVRTLTEQEMVDMMVGSSIQATRSSNSETLIRRVREAIAQGKRFTMIAVDDLPDDWTVVIPSAIGGGGAWEYVRERTDRQELPVVSDAMLKAIEALSAHVGKTFRAVIRTEAAGCVPGQTSHLHVFEQIAEGE